MTRRTPASGRSWDRTWARARAEKTAKARALEWAHALGASWDAGWGVDSVERRVRATVETLAALSAINQYTFCCAEGWERGKGHSQWEKKRDYRRVGVSYCKVGMWKWDRACGAVQAHAEWKHV